MHILKLDNNVQFIKMSLLPNALKLYCFKALLTQFIGGKN